VESAENGRTVRWDRAFELTSVVPLGSFVLLHALDYGRVLLGTGEIGVRRHPSLASVAVEVALIWLPLGFHVVWSFFVWRRRRPVETASAALVAHRIAGIVAGVFLLDHFVRFRLPILRGEAHPADSLVRLAAELSSTRGGIPWIAALHLAGTIAVAFHLAFGLRRIAERSERLRTSAVARASSIGVGVILGLVGVLTILRLAAGV
jgi:succinate dehydrogenase/fumarate reductase cytochrome b subunit